MIRVFFRCAGRAFATVVLLVAASRCWAVPDLDASNDVGASSTARDLRPNNFWAQSFTVTNGGLLSQIDVQLGQYAGADRDVTFELRTLVDGLPTVNDRERLFSSIIDSDSIPVINSLADPPPFLTVDVSSAGLRVKSGETYAISMRRSGSAPVAVWRSKSNSYEGGTGFFRSLLNVPWGPTVDDLGFQTWVDPTPSTPYKLRVDPTFDIHYRPGVEVSSLVEGEPSSIIGGSFGSESFPEERPILEFPIDDLPAGAVIEGAHLEFDWFGSSGSPRIEVVGYAGDGLASFSDATTVGSILALTGPTSASSPDEIPIDTNFVASLVGEASHLGIRMRSLDAPQYVAFATLEAHSSISPPRLVIDYSLPDFEGDFNLDNLVDGTDLAQWQGDFGLNDKSDSDDDGDSDGADFLAWQRHYGSGIPSTPTQSSVPEPCTASLVACALGLVFSVRSYHVFSR